MSVNVGLEIQIIAAILLDLAIGDPRWSYHPIRLIGRFASFLEEATRNLFGGTKLAGVVTVIDTVVIVGLVCYGAIEGAGMIHWLLGDLVSVLLLYFTFSARDLDLHASAVYRSLENGDIEQGRADVGFIVGRDTRNLDEGEITRATVESVAESTVDGVTAPLFFAVIGGPVGAMVYKSINTMDSLFGYKNEKYVNFGWAPARLDDLANYIPARLTAWLISLSSALLGLNWRNSLKILKRDGRKHPSPNSAMSESAFAGALDIQLGGVSYYGGVARNSATIGDPTRSLTAIVIMESIELMYATLAVTALFLIGLSLACYLFWL